MYNYYFTDTYLYLYNNTLCMYYDILSCYVRIISSISRDTTTDQVGSSQVCHAVVVLFFALLPPRTPSLARSIALLAPNVP